jgi:hypothetical protein
MWSGSAVHGPHAYASPGRWRRPYDRLRDQVLSPRDSAEFPLRLPEEVP